MAKQIFIILAILTFTTFMYVKNKTTTSYMEIKQNHTLEHIALGAGCFWCVEAAFMDLKGIDSVKSGYTGGHTSNPTYKEVCTGETGHAEVVYITYDPNIIPFTKILEVYFTVHDPTQINRQGNDIGTQYRSEIFYTTEQQKVASIQAISQLEQSGVFLLPIATKVTPLGAFYPAEEYHDNYFNINPENTYCQLVVKPKVEKIKKVFADLLK
jgi:peptide-methionine (S)-S-oxide reductase